MIFFFFKAEDGIRDSSVTGVQTCALPISLVAVVPVKFRPAAAVLLVAGMAGAAALGGAAVVWKEAQVNSLARRSWTRQAAAYLAAHYRAGDGIIYSFGDLTGVFREANIPLREGLHQGNRAEWEPAILRPDLFLHEEWALAVAGDPVATAVLKVQSRNPHYELRKQIIVEGAPAIEIYQRRWTKLQP